MQHKGCVQMSYCHVLGVVLWIIGVIADDIAPTSGIHEFCEDDTFRAKCAEDEVIIMTSARYGRMRLGTCLVTDYGHQGCSIDILREMDQRCSGQPSCDVEVRDLLDRVPQPCPKDLRNYMEASYICVQVVWPTVQRCMSSNPLVTMESGYLSNYVTEQTECGSIDSPWMIQVPRGQQINLTLYDFAFSPTAGEQPSICQVLAVIKDKAGGTSNTKTICTGVRRVENLQISQTHEVEVRFVLKSKPHSDAGRYHLIKFEAVGCADIERPLMWFKRAHNAARVGCEGSNEAWTLRCQDTDWVGQLPDCAQEEKLPQNVRMKTAHAVPYGVSVAIIMAIALLIGAIILTVGLVIIKRRRMQFPPARPPTQTLPHDPSKGGPKDEEYMQRLPYTDHSQVPHCYPDQSPYNSSNGENTYYRTWQLQRHAPHGGPPSQGATLGTPGHTCAASVPPIFPGQRLREDSPPRYTEHIYESPKSVRREVEALGGDSLKYFELDPNAADLKRQTDGDFVS